MTVSRFVVAFLFLLALLGAAPAAAQVGLTGGAPSGLAAQGPQEYQILGLSVQGMSDAARREYVRNMSGLQEGQTLQLPGDPAIADAIRRIYELGLFDDVEILRERTVGDGVFLTIRVEEVPKLADYTFDGVRGRDEDDLRDATPMLIKRMPVRPGDVARAQQAIADFYYDKGYPLASVDVQREERADNTVVLTFDVNRGPRAEVEDITFIGNEEVSDRRLRRTMDETQEDRWWRFWKREKFDRDAYRQDLAAIEAYYSKEGFYDARVVSDSFWVDTSGEEPEINVRVTVDEGPRYHVRDVAWEGNTVYPDAALDEALGLEQGDVFNTELMEQNLFATAQGTDVASLYMNRGYMRFNVEPRVRVVEGDSVDLTFDIYEGDVYSFGDIDIAGNTKTKEHVIRRELYTVPGQTFSRDAIRESIRRLSQLSYFDPASLEQGPGVELNEEEKEVDLTYNLTEVGGDQLELSGTWGRFGLVLMLRFTFNNFSMQNFMNADAWDPLPTGDGQQFSVGLQTNGRYYQSYSLSFTEPWFRGRPTPVGFGLNYSRYSASFFQDLETGTSTFSTGSARVFAQKRLDWPDDKFSAGATLRYRFYNNPTDSRGRRALSSLPGDLSQEIAPELAITRSSVDNPMFPSSGSTFRASVETALPLNGLTGAESFVQYHKWNLNTSWNLPLGNKLSVGFGANYGYIGSLTGDEVEFQRYLVGGSPFDQQGVGNSNYGKDVIYMRGYPARVIGPREGDVAVGGRILNKYTSELRWQAVTSAQFRASPYVFLDASNTWDRFGTYNPSELYRSAGVGARVMIPMLGMVELVYGYNFDEFEPITGVGERKWRFQFSLGQGFGN